MNWTSILIAGAIYDLTHLGFQTHTWELELKNKLKKVVSVDVRYSCHCFTRKPKEMEEINLDYVVMDHKELRLFDTLRYELSRQLPNLIAELPSQKVFGTRHNNLVRIALVDKEESQTEYFVFFTLTRQGKRMSMFIESAYPSILLEDRPKHEKAIRFLIALRNCYEGR